MGSDPSNPTTEADTAKPHRPSFAASIRFRVLLPLTGALMVLMCVLGAVAWSSESTVAKEDDVLLDRIMLVYHERLRMNGNKMRASLIAISESERLARSFLREDRSELLAQSRRLFERLREKHRITHFYFHRLDGTCYLRVHQPERHGDRIGRYTLAQCRRIGRPVSGCELGPLGTFTLRVVQPWYHEGDLIGYLELGEEVSHILNHMRAALSIDLSVLVDKTHLDRPGWQKGMAMLGRSANWDFHPRWVLVRTTYPTDGEQLTARLLSEKTDAASPRCVNLEWQGQHLSTRILPLHDARNQQVGQLLAIRDVSPQYYHARQHLLWIITCCLATTGVLFIAFHCYLGRVQAELSQRGQRLVDNNAMLRNAIRDRHKAERHLRTLIDTIPGPLFCKDSEGRYTDLNRAFSSEILGRDRKEILGKRMTQLTEAVPPHLAEEYARRDSELLEAGDRQSYEAQVRCADGQLRNYLFHKARLDSEGQEGHGIVGIMLDISSHKRMERALRDSRAFTRSVLDSLESEIVVLDDDGRIVQINQAWRAARRVAEHSGAGFHLGETYEQVMRRYCTHQCKGLQRLLKGIETVRQGARHAFQIEYPCRGGHRPRWLLARVTQLKHMGRTWCIVWHQDITDTKETELALRDSERRYRDLVTDMPSVVFRCANDRAWTMEFVSEAILAVTGYPAEDFLHNQRRTFESILHPDDRVRVWDVVHQAVEHHQPYAVEYRIRTAEDTTRWVHEKGRGVYDDEQDLLRLEGVIFDVTDQKKAEQQLKLAKEDAEAASRLKSQFLANMSHEIRTPMNGVVGMVELLCQTSLNQRQKRYVQAIQNSAEMLLTVINDILDYSKIEAGRLDLSSEPFDLRGAIEEIAQLTGSHARRKQVEVIVRMAIDLPEWIRGDGTRFRQVLLNLVGNAVKFTEDGTVVIDASRQDDRTGRPWLHLAVTDTGIGIPPDQIKAIFEKFTQGDPSTTRKFGGTGLGLAISHRLVEMMGGKIDVESQLGRGSCFRFSIPVDPVDPPTSQPMPPASIEVLAGLRVLVVDDNEINRRMLTETLEAWGLETLSARSGPEALEAVANSRPDAPAVDLVILDVCMPGMDGFELADQLREVPGLRQRSVLMFSSCEHGDEPQRCHDVGAGSYLVKPVRQSQLAKVLLQMVGQDVPSPTPSVSGSSQSTRSLRLLLAEDNPVNQEVAVELLQAMGHQVDVAGDGGQAVEMARAKDYDVILMDVQMPVMGGFEATEAIRRDQAGARHVPIIALTAHAMKGDDVRCRQAGMDGYVPKPIRGQAIAQAIAAVLDEADEAPADVPLPADPPEGAENVAAPLLARADVPLALPAPPEDVPTDPPDAQEASPATGPEPIDHEQLLHRCMDKPAIVHKVLARFLQTADATVNELANALDTKDWQRLTRVAHGLKGAAASIAAEELRAAAAELEQRAKAEAPEHAQTSLLRVRAALPAVRDDAHRVVQDNAPSLLP